MQQQTLIYRILCIYVHMLVKAPIKFTMPYNQLGILLFLELASRVPCEFSLYQMDLNFSP